jgi:hypothetical protein
MPLIHTHTFGPMTLEEGTDPVIGGKQARSRCTGRNGYANGNHTRQAFYRCAVNLPFGQYGPDPQECDGVRRFFISLGRLYGNPARSPLPLDQRRILEAYGQEREIDVWNGRVKVRMSKADRRNASADPIAGSFAEREYTGTGVSILRALVSPIAAATGQKATDPSMKRLRRLLQNQDQPGNVDCILNTLGRSYEGWLNAGDQDEMDRFENLLVDAFTGMTEKREGMTITLNTDYRVPGNPAVVDKVDIFMDVLLSSYNGTPPVIGQPIGNSL